MLTSSVPIESKFQEMMVDNLNAELVLGTVTNVKVGAGSWHEAVSWPKYSCIYHRMLPTPRAQSGAVARSQINTNVTACSPPSSPLQEAVSWLKYTYMYGRMVKNPLPYGATWDTLAVRGVGGGSMREAKGPGGGGPGRAEPCQCDDD